MPKFSQREKDIIKEDLKKKGEQLFISNSLKKVTIDDIANSVGIAKATFYRFYDCKEALFMDIAISNQKSIFQELTCLLENNKGDSDKKRVLEVFARMSSLLEDYPLLKGIGEDTVNLISRRIKAEQLNEYMRSNFDAVEVMCQHGIRFNCELHLVSEAFQAIYYSFLSLQSKNKETQEQVLDLLLGGLLDKILIF